MDNSPLPQALTFQDSVRFELFRKYQNALEAYRLVGKYSSFTSPINKARPHQREFISWVVALYLELKPALKKMKDPKLLKENNGEESLGKLEECLLKNEKIPYELAKKSFFALRSALSEFLIA